MIEEAVFAVLQAHAGLAALVDVRIYPGRLPQGVTYPAVTFQTISDVPASRGGGVDPALQRARVQVAAWDEDQLQALSVGQQIRSCLQRTRTTAAGVVIQDIYFQNRTVLDHPGTNDSAGAGKPIWQVALDFEFIYEG